MKRRRALLGGTGGLVVVVILALRTCMASPLPAGSPYEGDLPVAHPPEPMTLRRLSTGYVRRQASSAYRGGSFFEARSSAVIGALVRHPKGDLLIDTGFGRKIDEQFASMPLPFRMITSYVKERPAIEQLEASSYDPGRLRILLTHAHWDHTSGLADFPDVPVLITTDERAFVDDGGARTVIARTTPDVRWELYDFEGGAYLGFERSHDVFGDGSVVVVPCAGHTPGSVVVFVTLPTAKRYAFIGDLAWQGEGIREREERPWFWRKAVDDDEDAVRRELVRVSAISARFPDMTIVPAHDARAFADIPPLEN